MTGKLHGLSTVTLTSTLAALALAVSACSSSSSEAASSPPSLSPSTSVSTQSSGPTDTTSPSTKPRRTKSPLAPSSVVPVIRNGVTPHPSISAAPKPFTKPIVYSDGVKLTVTAIHQGRVTDTGPGVIEGPKTTFDLTFVNGSKKPVNLQQVVPTVEFGKPARTARPVYDDRTQDFAQTVEPGKSLKAVYAFMIPVRDLSRVTVHLDFDGRHYAAVFHGAARP